MQLDNPNTEDSEMQNPDLQTDNTSSENGSPALIPTASRVPAAGWSLVPPLKTGAQGLDPKTLVAAFRRRWFIATSLGIMLGAAAAGTVYQLVPAPYTAFAELHVKSVPEKVLFDTAETVAVFATYMETQMRMVHSPFVLTSALRNPEISRLSIVQEEQYPVQWLESELKITSPADEFIRIAISGDNPSELNRLVNAVSDAYMQEVVNSEQAKRGVRKSNLERHYLDMRDQLHKKKSQEKKLAESLNTSSSEALTAKQQMAVEYFAQLRKQHTQVRFELTRKRIQLDAHRTLNRDDVPIGIPETIIASETGKHPEIRQLTAKVDRAEQTLSRHQELLKPDHPMLAGLREKLSKVQNTLELARSDVRPTVVEELQKWASTETADLLSQKQLQREVELLAAEEQQLRAEVETQKLEARQIGISSFELESLKREVEQGEQLARSFSDEIQKLSVELQSPARVTLHRSSEIPRKPNVKTKYRLTAFAGLGGFGAVVGLMVWFEVLTRRISSTHEVADGLGLRILGSLPVMPGWMTKGKQSNGNAGKARRSVMRSVWTESVDAARTVLLRDSTVESTKTVMIASAMGGEGKTTLSCHLATSLARGARRTLLIDADMRRPSVHNVFGISQTPGFCELLRGEAQLDEIIQSVDQDGLSVIPAGKVNQETLRALAQEGTESIFEELKEQFDFIIVDSAPVLPVTDSLLIAQKVDSVLFSIRRDVSRQGKVSAACQRLLMLGVPVVGAVVIGLDETSYGYSGRYRYRHGNGYGYGGYGTYGYNYNIPSNEAL